MKKSCKHIFCGILKFELSFEDSYQLILIAWIIIYRSYFGIQITTIFGINQWGLRQKLKNNYTGARQHRKNEKNEWVHREKPLDWKKSLLNKDNNLKGHRYLVYPKTYQVICKKPVKKDDK